VTDEFPTRADRAIRDIAAFTLPAALGFAVTAFIGSAYLLGYLAAYGIALQSVRIDPVSAATPLARPRVIWTSTAVLRSRVQRAAGPIRCLRRVVREVCRQTRGCLACEEPVRTKDS
jgi:hypothetical protein